MEKQKTDICRNLREYLLCQKKVIDKYFDNNLYYNTTEGEDKRIEYTAIHLKLMKEIYCRSAIKGKECPRKGLCERLDG